MVLTADGRRKLRNECNKADKMVHRIIKLKNTEAREEYAEKMTEQEKVMVVVAGVSYPSFILLNNVFLEMSEKWQVGRGTL